MLHVFHMKITIHLNLLRTYCKKLFLNIPELLMLIDISNFIKIRPIIPYIGTYQL